MWRKKSTPSAHHPRVAVLHVPKTAGTSLLAIARRNCRRAITYVFYPPEQISTPPPEPLRRGVLIGHFFFGYERRFFDQCDRVVFLREPVDRLASQVQYERSYFLRRQDSSYAAWFRDHPNPIDFIEHSRFWYFDNAMVRMVSGIGDSVPFGQLRSEHLEQAVENLAGFDFVGFQSSFEADMGRLMARYGWRGRVRRINASAERPSLGAAERERLARYGRLDAAFYESALAGGR